MTALIPAMFAAMVLAGSGSVFGVVIARVVWAHDLKHALRIDEIRSRTEVNLREIIAANKRQIDSLNQAIEIYQGQSK